jgi:hypothetical protein
MRSWIGATTSPGSQVTTAQEWIAVPSARLAFAQSPAKAKTSRDGRVIQTGF